MFLHFVQPVGWISEPSFGMSIIGNSGDVCRPWTLKRIRRGGSRFSFFFLPENMRFFEESGKRTSPLYVLLIYKRNSILKNLRIVLTLYFQRRVTAKFVSDQRRGQLRRVLFHRRLFNDIVAVGNNELRRALYQVFELMGYLTKLHQVKCLTLNDSEK